MGTRNDCKPTCSDPTSQNVVLDNVYDLSGIFKHKRVLYKKALKHVVIWFSFIQSSIVSSILLSSFGLLQNDTHERIVNTHYEACGIQFLYY